MSEMKQFTDHSLPIDSPMAPSERDSLEDAEQRMWAVQREEDSIIEKEGLWYVNGIYYGNSADSSKARFFEADTRVRERVRRRELESQTEARLLGRTRFPGNAETAQEVAAWEASVKANPPRRVTDFSS